jgi:uridine kinase
MLAFSPPSERPKILAIAGGSCSGKTTFAAHLRSYVGAENCHIIRQDNYYFDIRERGRATPLNFDIPEALDFDLLLENLRALSRNEAAILPQYEFTTHQRCPASKPVTPRPLIIVEGILLLTQPKLCSIFDQSVYIRCGAALRLSRRLERDMAERGRTEADILRQFHEQVEPAHQKFVSPSQTQASLIIMQAEYLSDISELTNSVMGLMQATVKES